MPKARTTDEEDENRVELSFSAWHKPWKRPQQLFHGIMGNGNDNKCNGDDNGNDVGLKRKTAEVWW